MNNKKKKRRIKKQLIFNLISIFIIGIFGTYYLGRLIYYKKESEKPIVYSDILADHVVERIYKYDVNPSLVKKNDIYRYVNDANNNYVEFMGYSWRIVKINADKTVTLITEDPVMSLAYGNISDYADSQVNMWLNPIGEEKYTGIFYNSIKANDEYLTNTRTCLDSFNSIENIGCYETNSDYKVSLLNIKDYAEAGGANSYLNNGSYFWTTNKNKNNEFWYISEDGKTGISPTDIEYGIRPVITLAAGTKTLGGTGTSDDPYIIKEHAPETLKDIYIGEYLVLNDSLWRVVYKSSKSIKVVSEDYIKDENGNDLELHYSDYNNFSSLTDTSSLLYYLNTTYYNNFKEKDLIIKGQFYNGEFDSAGDYDYRTTYNSKVSAYIGLLSLAEPFVYDAGNSFTISKNIENELSIFIIDEQKLLFEDAITSAHYVRPALYINHDAVINGGDGSYLSPYTIESEVNNGTES